MTGTLQRCLCECGQAERVSKGKGCAECERIDRIRYAAESPTSRVLRQLARQGDWLSTPDLSDMIDMPADRIGWALRWLIRNGDVEQCGRSTAAKYRARSKE